MNHTAILGFGDIRWTDLQSTWTKHWSTFFRDQCPCIVPRDIDFTIILIYRCFCYHLPILIHTCWFSFQLCVIPYMYAYVNLEAFQMTHKAGYDAYKGIPG